MNIRLLLLISLLNLGWLTITDSSAALGTLAPLLPIAAVTGHTGLITSGLAGAGLLKLKAAATIAAFLSLRRKKHYGGDRGGGWGWQPPKSSHGWEPEPPSHGWQPAPQTQGWQPALQTQGWQPQPYIVKVSHGWQGPPPPPRGWGQGGGGQGGYHRRRRAVESNDARGETLENMELKDFDPTLDEVLQYDQLGCGMRLVCELSATPQDSLQEDEKLILELFGRDEKAPNPNRASRGKLSYSYAALLGSHGKDSNVCSRVYGRCPYTGTQVMQSLRDANI